MPLSELVPQPENRFKNRTAPLQLQNQLYKVSSAVEIKPYLLCHGLPVELFKDDKDEEG